MGEARPQPFGLKAIIVFYVVGVVAVLFSLLSNDRAAVGAQLASVHGTLWLPAVPAIVLTALLGALVVVALNCGRRWGFWLVVGYMVFLLLFPAWVLGSDHVSLFANVVWPVILVAYLVVRRRHFGVGRSARQAHGAEGQKVD
jgi:hypothetical protein